MILTILLFLGWLKHKAQSKQSKIVRLCLCSGDKREDCCIKRKTLDTIGNVDELLSKLELRKNGELDRSNTNSKWKWDQTNDCEFYLILLYDKDGKRIPEYEIVAPRDKTTRAFPKAVTDMRVLSLFETNSEHGFIDVFKASYLILDYHLVIELPERSTSRPSPTHFGFLCHDNYKSSDRVAAKKIILKDAASCDEKQKWQNAWTQVELALKAGGQHNTKLLACADVASERNEEYAWIAMELCIRTFDRLILQKGPDLTFLIDHDKMKICFSHIMLGLTHLHSKRIKHGEMIPANVLLTQDGDYLKITEYHYVENAYVDAVDQEQQQLLRPEIQEDVNMTAHMFYRCLRRDSLTYSLDAASINCDEDNTWISSLPLSDKDLLEFTRESVYVLLRIIYFEKDSNSLKREITGFLDKASKKPDYVNSGFSRLWIDLLKALAEKLTECHESATQTDKSGNSEGAKTADKNGSNPEPYLSAYLIMHMILDRPAAKDVLKHPFFWSEYKMLSFVTRMDGCFYAEKVGTGTQNTKSGLLKDVQDRFTEAYMGLEPKWSVLENKIKSICQATVTKAMIDDGGMDKNVKRVYEGMIKGAPTESNGNDNKSNEIIVFLRYIRNVHAHYHEPVKSAKNLREVLKDNAGNILKKHSFESTAEVWKFFNGLYPEMICLLHRAVWMERNNELLLDDIRQFFGETKHTNTLELGEERM